MHRREDTLSFFLSPLFLPLSLLNDRTSFFFPPPSFIETPPLLPFLPPSSSFFTPPATRDRKTLERVVVKAAKEKSKQAKSIIGNSSLVSRSAHYACACLFISNLVSPFHTSFFLFEIHLKFIKRDTQDKLKCKSTFSKQDPLFHLSTAQAGLPPLCSLTKGGFEEILIQFALE